ncbi:hypothetical protein HY486_02520 [Candidatus Woesearchaeota archaeon]|nr:hypothetical protein [Candidatus Woesearchaeota archaeon]
MRILIVAKESKYEWDRKKFGISHEELVKKYSSEGANLKVIIDSHEHQLFVRKRFAELLPDARMIAMSGLKEPVKEQDLVVSLGGDNSFTYVTHFLDSIPIMGVNSDPSRSIGALCGWGSETPEQVIERIHNKQYRINKWTRLEGFVDNKPMALGTSEYFFGERLREFMSRHVLVYRGRLGEMKYEQKNSGFIFATGAGSTGWYDSTVRYLHNEGRVFAPTEQKAVFIATEPYRFKRGVNIFEGELFPGDVVELQSLNDSEGIATSDCWENYEFHRGSTAIIRVSNQPLNVIVPESS